MLKLLWFCDIPKFINFAADPIFENHFWMDTYFDNETEEYRFSHSNDLVSDFGFIVPEVSLLLNQMEGKM